MSASARKNDPFHFDEIYKQAGVEDLFVKKTMGELKQKQPTAPAPSASPVRPAAATPAPRPAPNAANFDLDFLATIATPGGTPHNLSKPSSASNLTAASSTSSWQQPQPQPQLHQAPRQPPVKAPPPQKALDDPFALFEELPGAAPPQKHVPPPAPVRLGTGGSDTLLDFDEVAGGPPAAAGPAAPSFSLLSPTGPPPRPAAPPAQPPPQPHPPSPPPPPQQVQPLSQPTFQHQQAPAAPAPAAAPARPLAPAAETRAASSPPPPPDYADHMQHRPAPPGPADMPAGPAGRDLPVSRGPVPSVVPPVTATDYHAPQAPHHPRAEQTPQAHAQAHPPPHSYEELSYGPEGSEPSNSSNPSFTWSHAPSGSGISGYLKAFGKKAVRAAKAGLAQLEQALEGIDQPTHGTQQHQHQQHYPQGGQRVTSTQGAGRGRSDPDPNDVSNDEALAWAVRLADLPPHAQQQTLAQMATPLRRRVIEVLREQVRAEHSAVAPGASPTAPSDLGAGPGHGAATAAPAPPPQVSSQGASRPASRPNSQDGGPPLVQQGSGPVGRPAPAAATAAATAAAAAPPPPPPATYSDAVQHPAAAPPPAVPHADLLGFGSGDLRSPPGAAAASTAPAAAAAIPKSAPVVEDLLGFGDDGPSSAARPAGATPTAPPSSGRAAAPAAPAAAQAPRPSPPSPPPPPTAAAVHVDDMDDFFSGGGKPAPAPSGGSASMHGSSSAPNLGTARAAGGGGGVGGGGGGGGGGGVGNSSSAAALADMLHGSDDEGGADVDVSGYADLYKGEAGAADEPELRRRLRAQREAAKHAKMKAALAEKLAKDAEEVARREQQVALKDQYKADIEAWKNKNKGNIRGLLGSLHTVLWADSGWAPVSVGDLLEPLQVKKVYMRANLLVHPDKVRQRSGTAEQVAIADMVFDTLKDAWNAFR